MNCPFGPGPWEYGKITYGKKRLNYKWPVDRTLVISRVLIENGQVAFTFSNLVKFLRLFCPVFKCPKIDQDKSFVEF